MKRKYSIVALLLLIFIVSCDKNDDGGTFEYKKPTVKKSEFTDPRDGYTYKCIEVNGQVWMAENFRYLPKGSCLYGCYTYHQDPPSASALTASQIKTAINNFLVKPYIPLEIRNEIIKRIDVDRATAKQILEEFEKDLPIQFFDNISGVFTPFDTDYYKEYGLLYLYTSAVKYAPEGWRVPTDEDWSKLEASVGMPREEIEKLDLWRGEGVSKGLKEESDGIGFDAKYAGGRMQTTAGGYGTNFFMKGAKAYFWSSSTVKMDTSTYAVTRILYNKNDAIMKATSVVSNVAYSVRYIKK